MGRPAETSPQGGRLARSPSLARRGQPPRPLFLTLAFQSEHRADIVYAPQGGFARVYLCIEPDGVSHKALKVIDKQQLKSTKTKSKVSSPAVH